MARKHMPGKAGDASQRRRINYDAVDGYSDDVKADPSKAGRLDKLQKSLKHQCAALKRQ
jgi:ATP-dependent DNA helicase DinG